MCVVISILVLGILFIAFSTQYFENDKYETIERNAKFAANVSASGYYSAGQGTYILNSRDIIASYNLLSASTGSDFFLVDKEGNILYSTDFNDMLVDGFTTIPIGIVETALTAGYQNTGILRGVSNSPGYIVGVPVVIDNNKIAAVFAVARADDLMEFISVLIRMFLVSTVIVLIIAFVIIYFFTSKMVRPLKQMLRATSSFAAGDFSVRVPVTTEDEIGQLATAFNDMASTLSITENSRRSFVANVSHELKTPMTTIGGFVDGILDGTIPPENQNHYLKIVSAEVKRLTRLVHSMLDSARIEAGEWKLEKHVFDISELVRQTIFSFEQSVEEKELSLKGLEIDKIMVYADEDLMHQVVYNILENAVKFVDIGGEISVFYEEKDGKIYTTIRNTGDGLTKEESAQIFDRFYKSDRSRTGQRGGVGLGLHIVKTVIQYHEGEVYANSIEGEYTEFTFGVPSAETANGTEESKNDR